MDWQAAFNVALFVAGGGVALYVASVKEEGKRMRNDYNNLASAVTTLREAIPMRYATIDDLNRSVDQVNARVGDVFSVVTRIENKLDHKADK
jgi:GTPase